MAGKAVKLYRGDTWARSWRVLQPEGAPVDLADAAARLQVRDAAGALVMAASTADGRLSIASAEGRIDLVMPYAATNVAPGSYRFDLELTYADGTRKTVEQAALVVLEDVSRD